MTEIIKVKVLRIMNKLDNKIKITNQENCKYCPSAYNSCCLYRDYISLSRCNMVILLRERNRRNTAVSRVHQDLCSEILSKFAYTVTKMRFTFRRKIVFFAVISEERLLHNEVMGITSTCETAYRNV